MLSENIKTLRKQKGYSQELLAEQLHVVRQTVSKWEQGLSVPDAEMLKTLSEVLETPVSTLLGANISPEPDPGRSVSETQMSEIAKQLAVLNEQLANRTARRRRTVKRVVIGAAIGIFVLFILYIGLFILYKTVRNKNLVMYETAVSCELGGKTYGYSVRYEQNGNVHEAGGDAWISDHVMPNYENCDAYVMLAQIEDYFRDRGGTFKIVSTDDPRFSTEEQ